MDLFENTSEKLRRRIFRPIPAILLIAVCIVFFLGTGRAGKETLKKEQETLEQALLHGAIHTYTLTGCYPESLEYLLEEYNIQYDHDRFIVEYVPDGSNLLPAIHVILLEKGGFS